MNINKLILVCFLALIVSVKTCFAASLQEGITAYNSGKYAIAESKFRSALQNDPNNVNIRYYFAVSLAQQGKYSEAKSNYQFVLAKSPGSQAAYWAGIGLKSINNYSGCSKQQSSVSKVTLDIEEHNSVIIVNNVLLNNKETANFIVDTGATYTIISSDLANKLGLNLSNVQTVTLITGNGPIKASKTIIKSIEVGGLTANNIEVAISNLGTNKSLPGLLGMSFLKNFKVTIDKSAGKLTLEKN